MTIWKFSLDGLGLPTWTVSMPAGAQVLHVGLDPAADPKTGTMAIWAVVAKNAPKVDRIVHAVGTGWPIERDDAYLGSVIDRPFVWHLYIEAEPA